MNTENLKLFRVRHQRPPPPHAFQVSFGEFMTAIHHARHQFTDAGTSNATEKTTRPSGQQEFALVAEKMDAMVIDIIRNNRHNFAATLI